MRERARSLGERLRRTMIIGVGAVGALAAIDAGLLFCVLLLAAIFIAPANPYLGLVMFLAVPVTVVVGGALAWAGYRALMDGTAEPDHEDPHAEVPDAHGHHVHL